MDELTDVFLAIQGPRWPWILWVSMAPSRWVRTDPCVTHRILRVRVMAAPVGRSRHIIITAPCRGVQHMIRCDNRA